MLLQINISEIISRSISILGGKCPLYIDDSVNLRIAVKRLVWGKMVNLGQTCVAPDYVLCSSKVREKLVPMIKEVPKLFYFGKNSKSNFNCFLQVSEEFFGKEPEKSSDICRIVNDRHYKRLCSLIQNTKSDIVKQGKCTEEDRFIGNFKHTNFNC